MRMLQTLLLLMGAVAVLVIGSGVMPASAAEVAPCHAEGAARHGAPDQPGPSKAMTVMACCVACLATPLPQPRDAVATVVPTQRHALLPVALPRGLIPSPEPFPPRA